MPFSLKSVLDGDPDLEGIYFAEDLENSILLYSLEEMELRYGSHDSSGLPFSAQLSINGTPLATVIFPPAYNNKPFAVIYNGQTYYGIFADPEINL
jgi:hypothetical protein